MSRSWEWTTCRTWQTAELPIKIGQQGSKWTQSAIWKMIAFFALWLDHGLNRGTFKELSEDGIGKVMNQSTGERYPQQNGDVHSPRYRSSRTWAFFWSQQGIHLNIYVPIHEYLFACSAKYQDERFDPWFMYNVCSTVYNVKLCGILWPSLLWSKKGNFLWNILD
jgi:hypothetical protein